MEISGRSSPAGSSSAAAMFTVLTMQFFTRREKRLHLGLPRTDIGPGWSRTTPNACV
eukprot:CAMPEP_0175527522 /NCGR_PEP_ID=MMETSP0096-20121207/20169_1 /TAXON_ID=311494 /ORGANISM="Alexandrium monilatum, Strain CCMP3105" /LENGTH=56 /DNA_ID=CAMNT_0016830175 /DNA_START=16 /DNA_END=182 /DNA_ORIENTATION=-